jgi:uncharacterized protein YegL
MGWAKYHEDNISRHWRDAKTKVRMERMAEVPSSSKPPSSKDLGKIRSLRRRLAENPSDLQAQQDFHAEKDRLEKLGVSPSELLGVIHGDAPRLAAATLDNHIAQGNKKVLKDFTIATARPLPVIVLADVSGSMSKNGKIDALNDAIQSMIESFAAEDHSRAEIHIAVITFGKGVARLHQPLLPAAQINWVRVGAEGNTPMGAAFDLVVKMVEDHAQIPSRAYRPTVVLVSDGQPTDEWHEPLQRLLASDRASKASRFALGIGDDADPAMLAEFLADPSARVYSAHEARQIKNFFRWVTMSVTQRTRSMNPNSVVVIDPTALDDYDF